MRRGRCKRTRLRPTAPCAEGHARGEHLVLTLANRLRLFRKGCSDSFEPFCRRCRPRAPAREAPGPRTAGGVATGVDDAHHVNLPLLLREFTDMLEINGMPASRTSLRITFRIGLETRLGGHSALAKLAGGRTGISAREFESLSWLRIKAFRPPRWRERKFDRRASQFHRQIPTDEAPS